MVPIRGVGHFVAIDNNYNILKNEKTVLNSAAFYTYFIIIHLPKETKDNIKFNLHRYYCYYY